MVKKAKKNPKFYIPNLGNLELLQIIASSDASFTNLTDGGSQGGYIMFLVGRYIPIAWQSKRIKRVEHPQCHSWSDWVALQKIDTGSIAAGRSSYNYENKVQNRQ